MESEGEGRGGIENTGRRPVRGEGGRDNRADQYLIANRQLIGQINTLWLETCQRGNASPEGSRRAKVILSVLLSLYPSLSMPEDVVFLCVQFASLSQLLTIK